MLLLLLLLLSLPELLEGDGGTASTVTTDVGAEFVVAGGRLAMVEDSSTCTNVPLLFLLDLLAPRQLVVVDGGQYKVLTTPPLGEDDAVVGEDGTVAHDDDEDPVLEAEESQERLGKVNGGAIMLSLAGRVPMLTPVLK